MKKKIMLRVKKVYFHLFGKIHNVINVRNYMKHYTKYLRQLGIKIQGTPGYISSDAYFDSHFYGAISIGSEVTISREVMVLCHDYSIVQGLKSIGKYDYKIETGIPHAMGGG